MDKKEDGFVPPRHWIGPEELKASYWSNPEVQAKRGSEFFEKPMDAIARMDTVGLARREFLTVMGASMAMATLACARRPVHKIIPFVVQPEEIVPGVPNHYASTCGECSAGCGTVVKTREGRPIKIEGNPHHEVNRGRLCARGQASLLGLYDPDRLKLPVHQKRGVVPEEMSWEALDAAVVRVLRLSMKDQARVRVLTGAVTSPSLRALLKTFTGAFRQGAHVEYEPLAVESLALGQESSYGSALVPRIMLDKATYVLSFSADFLGTGISPVEHAGDWAKARLSGEGDKARMSKLICFEAPMTVTGANADERFAILPGDELSLALAIVHSLIIGKKIGGIFDPSFLKTLATYTPLRVAKATGIEEIVIHRIAEDLVKHRGASLVLAGGTQPVALHVVVNLLNSILGNEGVTIDGVRDVSLVMSRYAQMYQLVHDMQSGKVDVLITVGVNPVYVIPEEQLPFQAALKRVQTVIRIAPNLDETAHVADYVVPRAHFLESWGDYESRVGLWSVQQPTISPLHGARSCEDTLIAWGHALGVIAATDAHEYVKSYWKEHIYQKQSAVSFEAFWEGVLREGFVKVSKGALYARTFRYPALSGLPEYIGKVALGNGPSGITATLVLTPSHSLFDGRHANNPWLQELPDPITSVTWDNYASISPGFAKTLGVKNDDVIRLNHTHNLAVYVQPGLRDGVLHVALGYGRGAAGKVGTGAGINAFHWVGSRGPAQQQFSGQVVQVEKTGMFYQLASTQWHTATEHRPIINDITLQEYRKDPAAHSETDPELRAETPSIWPEHTYTTYKWGMSIDMTACTGCGACVIACQAENNVPVVGREQVRVSRQMHWIRIDRYYSGAPEHPDVIFQPMLCQHCENAPCETVCPVLATVHDDEGLNVQVYNRCVGTRYCQNNCPYKVRRFNFFDHWKSYEGTMNMVWNPDVTVRTRGIMEKCTFCVQRIADAKDRAKDAGENVHDGQFQTACQQTCPTNAIVFGNRNDAASKVSRLAGSARAFRSLEVLNVKPAISYLTKVRNKPAKEAKA